MRRFPLFLARSVFQELIAEFANAAAVAPDAVAQKASAESISLKPTNQSPYNRHKP